MEQRLSDALQAILERLEKGQRLESLLTEYPDLADELRPLVESALFVPQARVNRAEVQAMRSRLDSAFDSQLATMQFPKRQTRRPLLALVASLGLVICGIWFFLPRGENPSAEEIQLTQSQLEASETLIFTASPSSSPTESQVPTSSPTETQIPPSSTATNTLPAMQMLPSSTAAPSTKTAAPSPSTAPTSSSQAANCNPRSDWEIYIIQAGDTLSQIALDSGASVTELLQANCLENARDIMVGQKLYVPRLWDDDDNSGSSDDDNSDDSEIDNSGSSNDDNSGDDDDADDDNSGSSDDSDDDSDDSDDDDAADDD